MKTLSYLSVAIFTCIVLVRCSKEDLQPSTENTFLFLASDQTELFYPSTVAGQGISVPVFAVLHSANRSNDVRYSFEVLPGSTAIEGTHYTLESSTGLITTDAVKDTLPIKVFPASLIPCQSLSLQIKLTSSDIERTDAGIISLSLNLESSSALAGMATYIHTENFTGEVLTGNVNITALENAGEYVVSDFSFGAWDEAYGIDPPTGTLKWSNNCASIRLSGTDNYGDVWKMDEILESGGEKFTFTWSNTYGEYGRVELLREDGFNWPLLELNR